MAPLHLALVLMNLLDLALTWAGLSLGLIQEANPLMKWAIQSQPLWAYVIKAASPLPYICLAVWAKEKIPWLAAAAYGLLIVYSLVIGLHLTWLVPEILAGKLLAVCPLF